MSWSHRAKSGKGHGPACAATAAHDVSMRVERLQAMRVAITVQNRHEGRGFHERARQELISYRVTFLDVEAARSGISPPGE